MAKAGRKAKITEKSYLNAVRKTRSFDDLKIADRLGVNRSSVYRFRTSNPLVVEKAKVIIASFESVRFDPTNITLDMFRQIPVIREWKELQSGTVGNDTMTGRTSALFRVCNHLNIHPDQLNIDDCAKLVKDAKKAKDNKLEWYEGLSYYTIRKPLRSFFQLVRGISGELLTTKGIDAGRSKGTGSHSKQRVTKEQRRRVIDAFPDATKEIINSSRYQRFIPYMDEIICEMKGLTYFMYYTATRIGSTNPKDQGSLSVRLNNEKNKVGIDEWSINLLDKGKGGGIEWDKILIDDGIVKMKEYVTERFNLNVDTFEVDMVNTPSFMFPILNENYDLEVKIMKLALEIAGCKTNIPNHIWRHTFAQDFLHSTDWNYELCASIGGWKDTGTLKLSYGQMSEDAKRRGLRKAMGLPVEDVTYELRF